MNKIQKIKSYLFEINQEDGKISLNKIINLLNKFDRNKTEEKSNDQENNDEQIDINNESEKGENGEEQDKEQKQEAEQIDDLNKEENENKEENKEEDKNKENDEKEKSQDNEDFGNKTKTNKGIDMKESVKNDEASSPRNESELFSSSNKKFRKSDDIKNNFFNSMFYNQ